MKTGHVSPQFHVVFDDFFETLRPSAGNPRPVSDWQKVTGLKKTKSLRPLKTSREYTPSIPMSETVRWTEDEIMDHEIEMPVENQTSGDQHTRNENTIDVNVEASEQSVVDTTATDTPSNQGATTTRSRRVSRPTSLRLTESLEQREAGIVSLFVAWEVFHDDSYKIQDDMENPIAFVASTNKDVMYVDQAMREPDKPEFEQAMIKEVDTHTQNGNWIIVPRSEVPVGTKVLPAVWAMRRKRRITTGEVYKWKARLNIHGGKQEYGVNYWETTLDSTIERKGRTPQQNRRSDYIATCMENQWRSNGIIGASLAS